MNVNQKMVMKIIFFMFSNFLLSNYFNAFSFIKNWCKLHGNLSTYYHYLYFAWYTQSCDIFSQKKTIYVQWRSYAEVQKHVLPHHFDKKKEKREREREREDDNKH